MRLVVMLVFNLHNDIMTTLEDVTTGSPAHNNQVKVILPQWWQDISEEALFSRFLRIGQAKCEVM